MVSSSPCREFRSYNSLTISKKTGGRGGPEKPTTFLRAIREMRSEGKLLSLRVERQSDTDDYISLEQKPRRRCHAMKT